MPSKETEDQLSLRSVVPNSRGSGIYPHLGARPAHCGAAVRDSKDNLVPQQRGHSLELLARGRTRGQSQVGHAVQMPHQECHLQAFVSSGQAGTLGTQV